MSKQPTVKEQCQPPTRPEWDFSDPQWSEGFADGQNQKWTSAPDMRKGLRYAHGWITGRLQSFPASLHIN